jgi:hypothetical protein
MSLLYISASLQTQALFKDSKFHKYNELERIECLYYSCRKCTSCEFLYSIIQTVILIVYYIRPTQQRNMLRHVLLHGTHCTLNREEIRKGQKENYMFYANKF